MSTSISPLVTVLLTHRKCPLAIGFSLTSGLRTGTIPLVFHSITRNFQEDYVMVILVSPRGVSNSENPGLAEVVKVKGFPGKAFIAIILGTFTLWTACGGGGAGSPISPPTGSSLNNLSFYLTDAPLDGVQSLWVALNSISIRNADTNEWQNVVSFSPAQEFDILSLQTVRQLVASVRVPPGTYNSIRVDLADVRVVRNGDSRSVTLATNAIDLPVTFTVSETGVVEITIDIEASLALIESQTGLRFDPTRIKVLPPVALMVLPPGASGDEVPPPPDNGNDPSRRPVVVKGKVLAIFPENLAFIMQRDGSDDGLSPQEHPGNLGHQILVLTRKDTRYFPEGKGFGDLAIGMTVAVAGTPVISGNQDAIVAFEVYMRPEEPPSNDTVRGIILEVLKDLRLVKVGKPWDDPIRPISGDDGGDHPGRWHPPMDYTWVAITDGTQIVNPDGTPLTIDDLRVGQFTEVSGVWRASDIFEAYTMIVFDQGPPPQPEQIAGVIVEINATDHMLTVVVGVPGGPWDPVVPESHEREPVKLVNVKVTENTIIQGQDGQALTFEELRVGMTIEAVGRFEGDVLIADRIRVLGGPPEVVPFAGIIREKDDASRILVLEYPRPLGDDTGVELPPLRIKVTEDTQIEDASGNPLTWIDLAIGQFIRGEGKPIPEEQLIVAHWIRVGETPPPSPPSVVVGRITDIHPESRSFILAVGDASGGGSGGGTPPTGGWHPQGFDDPGSSHETLVEVFTNDDTEFVDSDGSLFAFEDLNIGDFVECIGEWTPQEDAPPGFHARRVQRIQPPPLVVVHGVILEINAEQKAFLLAPEVGADDPNAPDHAIWVETTPETRFFDDQGNPLSFEDLQVGNVVTVGGRWGEEPPGERPVLIASFVVRHEGPPPPPPGIVAGRIVEIFSDRRAFVIEVPLRDANAVGRINILTNESTLFFGPDGQPIAFEDLAVGDFVKVIGEWMPGDPQHPPAMMAHEVHKHAPPPPPPEPPPFVFGIVSGLEVHPEGGRFNLQPPCDEAEIGRPHGINVSFDHNVVVVDRNDNPIPIETLANGQLVLVFGEWSMVTVFPPIFVAHKIVILDTDDSTSCVHGEVLEIDYEGRLILLSREPLSDDRIRIQVPPDAWILLPDGELIRLDDLHIGDILGVIGDWQEGEEEQTLVADLILKMMRPEPH